MGDLQVGTDSLRAAALSGEAVAEGLWADSATGPSGGQPSEAGVSVFDAALSAVQAHQSERVSNNADLLQASAAIYRTTDSDRRDQISRAL